MSEDRSLSVSEYQWCLDEFADVELKDARLNRRCGELAVQLAREGKAEMLMKGSLHTDELMSAVVRSATGLRTASASKYGRVDIAR